MSEKVGSLIIDLKNTFLSAVEKEILAHPWVSGVILFSRNYESRAQLTELCRTIRLVKQNLLIMVDQEGGRVQRFRDEFTSLPSMAHIGHLFNHSPNAAYEAAKECAWLMASELLSVGIDLSLAPVLDLNKEESEVIGDRAFHTDPLIVSQLAGYFLQGMHEAGMASTGKHFPGHGSIVFDSHTTVARDNRSMALIETEDLLPFVNLVKTGIKAIMISHIIFTQVDSMPAGFSSFWLQTILRSRLQFTGVILTDDLNMEGANISSHYSDRVLAAKEAGGDLVLLCNNQPAVIQVLDDLPYSGFMVEKPKWQSLQGNLIQQDQKRWQKAKQLLTYFDLT
jgi:beta-N-acetylhexosaminidase